MNMNDRNCSVSPKANSGNPEDQMDDDAVDDFMSYQPDCKKRRLTVDQVRSLEKSFEMETKLEPEKKIQLAQELGLQPRQVAVWFQNRRARWKTKQLERDYNILKVNYDALKSDFEVLQQEKENLLTELGSLKMKLQEADCCEGENCNDIDIPTTETSLSTSQNKKKSELDVAGVENNIDIKPFSDFALVFKDKDTALDKIDIKPVRVLLLNEKEGSFSPDSDEDKKPPHQILSQIAQASSSVKYPSTSSTNIVGGEGTHEQGLIQLAEALMALPPKACQQYIRVDEGFLHEEAACNIFVNVEEQGALSSLPWWEYWL